ncbi:hypothetical protein QQY79_18470 [Flavobacterium tructae]|uniref:hypothetical protein n=1 Tax=Flavobacterium tructae TaxID=1114873 RepID=UPI002551E383|nr:hypothetical protein [Flavobacterium tructae]MDL2144517.1 hypothetical protein [Flavobacterium tructae]
MEVEIRYNKEGLSAHKNNELLFYSTTKINFLNTNRTIKIYNHDNNLVLELFITESIINTNYKILYYNNSLLANIEEIGLDDIHFDGGKNLKKRYNNRIISYYLDYYYIHEQTKIAQVKHKVKNHRCKMLITIEDQNLTFLNQILIHILSTRTADLND